MKKIMIITAISLLALTGCYKDYVRDFDRTGVYVAYQYDLRTFVVGEGMKFKIGTVLSGTIGNPEDREVSIVLDENLVNGDLSIYGQANADGDVPPPFRAIDVMKGTSTAGSPSNGYVTAAVKKAGINDLVPLPSGYFSLSAQKMTIGQGQHTATVTVKADSLPFLSDAKTLQPYYAFAFKIKEANADTVLFTKSFSVIAVRYENKLFGNYWHGGVTTVRDNATGDELSKSVYQTTIPQADDRSYVLTTAGPMKLTTNRLGNGSGSLALDLGTDNKIVVSSADGSKTIEPVRDESLFNNARLLQNRKIFLNYKYDNGDGTSTFVTDTLTFRNRVRDGVNEWQDENPENYK